MLRVLLVDDDAVLPRLSQAKYILTYSGVQRQSPSRGSGETKSLRSWWSLQRCTL